MSRSSIEPPSEESRAQLRIAAAAPVSPSRRPSQRNEPGWASVGASRLPNYALFISAGVIFGLWAALRRGK